MRQVWRMLLRNPGGLIGVAILTMAIAVALIGPLLFPTSPWRMVQRPFLPPFTMANLPLGTDALGRDVMAGIIYGARVSLLVALSATVVAVILGVVLGITAGYFGGFVDSMVSRLMDLILAFPYLLFSIALISVVPVTTAWRIGVVVGVISFFSWPYIGRIVRGQTLSLREREFVEAARSVGAGPIRILFRELLPNLVAPILVYSTLVIPTNIVFEASLSFLGVGVLPPTPSWGRLLSDAVNYYTYDPVYMFVPGLAIFIMVLAFNLFGDGLRDALDPNANR